jgi:hypothetical protein
MAIGDFIILEPTNVGGRGGRLYNVAAGTPILAGEPVQHLAVGDVAVIPGRTSIPVVGTSGVEGLFVGIATTNSTNTTTAAGTVSVLPVRSDITYICSPTTAASWDTQSEYDALVGKRVLIQNNAFVGYSYVANSNAGTYSILASDSAANGCVVMAMNINEHPGKVAVAFRTRTSDVS